MENSVEYKLTPIDIPIKSENENCLRNAMNKFNVLSKKEGLKEYQFEDGKHSTFSIKQEILTNHSPAVLKLWPNITIKSEPEDSDDDIFSISNKKDYEDKCRMEFDGIIKTEKLGEYTTSQCCNKTLKKMKVSDDLSTISPQLSNISIKKEPLDIESEELSNPNDNELFNMTTKDLMINIKPDPTYQANLYTSSGTDQSPLEVGEDQPDNENNIITNLSNNDITIIQQNDINKINNRINTDKRLDFSYIQNNRDIIEESKKSNYISEKDSVQEQDHDEHDLLSYCDKTIVTESYINKIYNSIKTEIGSDFSYKQGKYDIIEEGKKSNYISEKDSDEEQDHNEHNLLSYCDKTIVTESDINKIYNSIKTEISSDFSYTQDKYDIIKEGEKSNFMNETEDSHQVQDHDEFEHLKTQLLKATRQHPDTLRTLLCLAREQFRLGNNDAALRYNDLVLIIQPKNLPALLNKGSIFANDGDLLRALEVFDNAMSEYPRSTQAKSYFCQTLKEMANRAKSMTNLKDIKIEHQFLNSKEEEDVFSHPKYKEECKEIGQISPLKSERKVEDFITSKSEMLKELNTSYNIDHKNFEDLSFKSQKQMLEDLNEAYNLDNKNYEELSFKSQSETPKELNTTYNLNENNYEEFTFKSQSDMLKEHNTELICNNHNLESKDYEELTFNTSDIKTNETYFITQNSIHKKIRLAIIGDTHALNYPLRLFSGQFDPYTFKYQPSIFSLHINNTMESILKECTQLDAAVIIIGGNDVAIAKAKDHDIIQAFIQATEILLRHNILPIIVPIMPRQTIIPPIIPPEVFNNRALEINIKLRSALCGWLKFNPLVDYIYHKPELQQDGINPTNTEYQNLTKKIIYHYFKTICQYRPG